MKMTTCKKTVRNKRRHRVPLDSPPQMFAFDKKETKVSSCPPSVFPSAHPSKQQRQDSRGNVSRLIANEELKRERKTPLHRSPLPSPETNPTPFHQLISFIRYSLAEAANLASDYALLVSHFIRIRVGGAARESRLRWENVITPDGAQCAGGKMFAWERGVVNNVAFQNVIAS